MRSTGLMGQSPAVLLKVVADRLAHPLRLLARDPRKHRQRERLCGERLRHWKVTAREAEATVRRRQVRRLGVVPSRLDTALGEKSGETLWIVRPDDIEVPDRIAS